MSQPEGARRSGPRGGVTAWLPVRRRMSAGTDVPRGVPCQPSGPVQRGLPLDDRPTDAIAGRRRPTGDASQSPTLLSETLSVLFVSLLQPPLKASFRCSDVRLCGPSTRGGAPLPFPSLVEHAGRKNMVSIEDHGLRAAYRPVRRGIAAAGSHKRPA